MVLNTKKDSDLKAFGPKILRLDTPTRVGIAGVSYRGSVVFRSKSTGQVSAKANDIGRCGRGSGHISAMINLGTSKSNDHSHQYLVLSR